MAQINPDAPHPRADICAACRGWCCYRFFLTFWDYPRRRGPKHAWELRYIKDTGVSDSDMEFVTKHFKRVRVAAEGFLPGSRMVAYTCDCYDVTAGTCLVYDDRPAICRKFVCDQALRENRVPGPKDYPYQTRSMRRLGISIEGGRDG